MMMMHEKAHYFKITEFNQGVQETLIKLDQTYICFSSFLSQECLPYS